MSAGWVAGSVKARLLLDRRAGTAAALELAGASSLEEAVAALSGTVYASAVTAATLEEAQHSVAGCTLSLLRVLAAWLPQRGAAGLRTLAAWFELANIEDRLAYLAGGPLRASFELGALASIWDSASRAQSSQELRTLLAGSSWGDPGTDDAQEILLALRFAWAGRVAAEVAEARLWAAGAAAVLLAEELFVGGHGVDPRCVRRCGLGAHWQEATSLAELRARLPTHAAWALAGSEDPSELWRAGSLWWRTVGLHAELMVRSSRADRTSVVGGAALLALDAVRVNAALAVAAHDRATPALEVLDALC